MTLSSATLASMFDESTGDGLLVLLTIDHADFSTPIRVVNNQVDVTSRGNEFIAFPFDIVLPSGDLSAAAAAELSIDNVSREILVAVRLAGGVPPTVLIEVIRLLALDTVEISFPALKMRNVRADVGKVLADLYITELQTEPYPSHTFTPGFFPGLFV